MNAPRQKIKNEFYQRDMVSKWRASGLSQAEFCRQEGIPEWSLSQWKRREESNSDLVALQSKQKAASDRKIKRLEAKRKYWLALVEEQAASGLSITEFSRRKGIKANSLKRWRRDLLGVEEQVISAARVRRNNKNPFVQVVLEEAPQSERHEKQEQDRVEILLPGGGKFIATEQTSQALLAKLLKALKEASC